MIKQHLLDGKLSKMSKQLIRYKNVVMTKEQFYTLLIKDGYIPSKEIKADDTSYHDYLRLAYKLGSKENTERYEKAAEKALIPKEMYELSKHDSSFTLSKYEYLIAKNIYDTL